MERRWIPLIALLAACEVGSDRTVVRDTRTLDPAGLTTLDLLQGQGDLIVEPSTDGQITIEVEMFGPIGDERDDAARESLVHLLEADGSVAWAETGLQDPPDGYRIRTLVRVPTNLLVVIEDGSGDLRVEGIGALELEDGSGDAVLVGLEGSIVVDDGSGDLTIEGCRGDVAIVDGSGDLSVTAHTGDVTIEDGSGDIVLRDIAGRVVVQADGSGDVAADGVDDLVLVQD